jgi:uncharacterized membrane protein
MFTIPPNPGWEGFHPLVIHFPIALLLVAPLLVIAGLFLKNHARGLLLGGFILMVLGTISTYVAVPTGKAAGELAERTPEISVVLAHHEELAETTRAVFTVLTLLYVVMHFGPGLLKREFSRKVILITHLVFLLLYGAGALILANTAHNGARLVHEFGVHSMMGAEPIPVPHDKE